jgi:Zn-dependent protease with chaperone function
MASDFFDRQDAARRSTARLVILFALAVLAIVISIHFILAAVFGYLDADPRTGALDWSLLFDPGLLLLAIVGTGIVVGGGSLFKIAQLRGGGRVVAEHLGGRLVSPDTADLSERQLMNVVEEMAIASGTSVPPVYLLEHEDGINAFAAGFTPSEAVIGVTRGAAERLTRDELQGVVAHEFSHILNGDMRINIRLIGLLHGILIIGMLGYFILRMSAFSGGRGRRSRDSGNPLPLIALGAGLAIVGFFGTFFGNLIKAAVSRQREFLADAAAVQFTRHPGGIAGALKKIGGASAGSSIRSPNAPEASHMFFGRATSGFNALFSTHPPLPERIRRVEPGWDGQFIESSAPAPAAAAATPPPRPQADRGFPFPGGAATAGLAGAMAHIGEPSTDHIAYAALLLQNLPAAITMAAHEPYGARALVYGLLLDRDADMRRAQLRQLQAAADPGVFEETLRLVPALAGLDRSARLPLVEIAVPALRTLSADEYRRFKRNVSMLIEADEQLDLFEWALQRVLLHGLDEHHGEAPRPGSGHRALSTLQAPCEVLLSALARAGGADERGAEAAFHHAWRVLELPGTRLLEEAEADFEALDKALDELAEAAPKAKRRILQAVTACIAADRQVTVAEGELLRAIAASLGVPVPPIIGGAAGGNVNDSHLSQERSTTEERR